MANKSVNNIKEVLKNPTSRVILILTFSVVGVGLVVANMVTTSKAQRPADLAAQVSVAGAPNVTAIPGTSDSTRHNDLVREYNKAEAKKALETGGSALPRLTATPDASQKDPFDLVQKKAEEKAAQAQDPSIPQPIATGQPTLVVQPALVKASAEVKAQRPVDERQIQQSIAGLLGSWNPVPQKIETDFTGKGAPTPTTGAASAGVAGQGVSALQASGQNGVPASPSVAVKAGTIMHAVVITSVNSDEPGPVLAQVVSGPFAGARLLGKFEMPQNAQKVVLTFNVMTMPSAAKSMSISTYAVEPETARTALASDVDNHYLQRYGTLMAASFMKGYAQAISQSGATQTVSLGAGGVASTTTFPTLDAKKTNMAALGEVGTALGTALAGNVNRPATVTLNSGTPVGILFMQDVSIQEK